MRNWLKTLGLIVQHPLNRPRRTRALVNYARWQIGSRLLPGTAAVPYVGPTRLLAKPGMTGVTGNVYCGLHEFEEMGFVLHALRPGDLFLDVGANVGSYTVLAAGACGAAVVAVEPIPTTFRHLTDNVRLNAIEPLVELCNVGLGDRPGELEFSADLDTVNHVLSGEERLRGGGVTVPVATVDALLAGRSPTLVKIDVEGFETQVVAGAGTTLGSPGLLAVLMELNGSGTRYGFDEEALHRKVLAYGFEACAYAPLTRTLQPSARRGTVSGNILYVRDLAGLRARVASAPSYAVHGVRL